MVVVCLRPDHMVSPMRAQARICESLALTHTTGGAGLLSYLPVISIVKNYFISPKINQHEIVIANKIGLSI